MLKALNLHNSYFAIGNPFSFFHRWLRPYRHQSQVRLNGRSLLVEWTEAAEKALNKSSNALTIEMQLYFSCVVKKRVLFHEDSDLDAVPVNGQFNVAFRSVQSAVCSPEDFARDYPQERELSAVNDKMTPSSLRLDFRNNQWLGEFGFGSR